MGPGGRGGKPSASRRLCPCRAPPADAAETRRNAWCGGRACASDSRRRQVTGCGRVHEAGVGELRRAAGGGHCQSLVQPGSLSGHSGRAGVLQPAHARCPWHAASGRTPLSLDSASWHARPCGGAPRAPRARLRAKQRGDRGAHMYCGAVVLVAAIVGCGGACSTAARCCHGVSVERVAALDRSTREL